MHLSGIITIATLASLYVIYFSVGPGQQKNKYHGPRIELPFIVHGLQRCSMTRQLVEMMNAHNRVGLVEISYQCVVLVDVVFGAEPLDKVFGLNYFGGNPPPSADSTPVGISPIKSLAF